MKNNSKEVVLKFNLPEFGMKDINIKISKNLISIQAAKKSENRVQKKDFFHQEKTHRAFSYVTSVPLIDLKKAKIQFKKGVLKITAPKE